MNKAGINASDDRIIITSYGEFYGDPSFVTELTDMIFEILPTGFSFFKFTE